MKDFTKKRVDQNAFIAPPAEVPLFHHFHRSRIAFSANANFDGSVRFINRIHRDSQYDLNRLTEGKRKLSGKGRLSPYLSGWSMW